MKHRVIDRRQSSIPLVWALALIAVAGVALVVGWNSDNRSTFGEKKSADESLATQHVRAWEPGRGRDAVSPWQIPLAGWKDILWRTYEEIGADRLLAIAAGVVFYGLLALFPAVTAFVSFYGLFANTSR